MSEQSSFVEHLLSAIPRHRVLLSVLTLYAIWYRASQSITRRPGTWGPRWLAVLVARFFSWLMDAIGSRRCSVKLPKGSWHDTQTMVVWHPHGPYTAMAFMHCAELNVTERPLSWFAGIAPVLFSLPLFREALLLLNARSVDARTLEAILAAGGNVGIQPGGIAEQMQSDERREIAVFHKRLGFIRLAMRHGVPLLPAYIFGENQAYRSSATAALTKAAYALTGIPMVYVLGRWNLPWMVPKKVDVHVVWGEPVHVGAPNTAPSDEQLHEVFDRYVAELRRLFDANKDACLPAYVAAKGLSVFVMDGKHATELPAPKAESQARAGGEPRSNL
mmetsp:Transcript_37687/g.79261  ORF Transcript_37687/g.79261 Transcript_37687/m.79261 type:complete len:332 (-) Transcript_37687:721-1716(-)